MRTVDPGLWRERRARARLVRVLQPRDNVERRLRDSFRDAMREYWQHCSLQGVAARTGRNLSPLDRYGRLATAVSALTLAAALSAVQLLQQAHAPPLQVTQLEAQHSIRSIPFPAVALCSTNLIARDKLYNYTKYLYIKDRNSTYRLKEIYSNLLHFSGLLTMVSTPVDIMFMQYLSRMDPGFNVTKIMFQLSPSCSDLLVMCSWRGRVVPCEKLFAPRVTPLGHCCVFNSRYYKNDIYRTPRYLDMIGRDFGLNIVVYENPDNFAFTRRPNIGLEILLFDGTEYPLLEGGGVRIFPAGQNSSMSLVLQARTQLPAADVRRGCRRRPAHTSLPRARRSYSWCLTQCRVRTLSSLCGCQLYTLPPHPTAADPQCSLAHLACLAKHREKLIYYVPEEYTSASSLEEELQNGQECSGCAPDCTRYIYGASLHTFKYSQVNGNKMFKNAFTKTRSLVNTTTIRLHYASDRQKQYQVEVNCRWYESFVSLSSEWCGACGVTLCAGAELLFHCTLRWAHHYRRRSRPLHAAHN